MSKRNAVVLKISANGVHTNINAQQPESWMRRPQNKEGYVKVLNERCRSLSKFKDALYMEERKA